MRSRTLREGSVGLLILGSLGLLGGVLLWLRGFNPANQSYVVTIDFTDLRGLADVSGIQVGANVRYRGVNVGRVTDSRIRTNGLEVDVEIAPATLVIPKDVTIEFSQGGLIGETSIDIIPKQAVPENLLSANPTASDCDKATILCNGDRVPGQIGTSFRKLVDSSIKFADLFGRQEFFDEVLALTKNTSKAAAGVTILTREVTGLTTSVKQNLNELTDKANNTANSVAATSVSINQAATQVGLTAAQVNALVAENRSGLVNTLDNINQTSSDLQELASGLKPALGADSEIIQNLETLSSNAAEASSNLRNLSSTFGSPENVVLLQQTLESARATLQNTQKITSDLDELTGDPELRERIRNLIIGLSGLVSSTQQLNQQTQYAQILNNTQLAQAHRDKTRETADTPPLDEALPLSPRPAPSPFRSSQPEQLQPEQLQPEQLQPEQLQIDPFPPGSAQTPFLGK